MTHEAVSSAPHTPGFAGRYPLLYGVFGSPEPRTLILASLAALMFYVFVHLGMLATATDFVLPGKAVVGGDFVVFWMAAKTFIADGAAALYQSDVLNTKLNDAFPLRGGFSLFWQYPPMVYFVIAPLAVLPYPAALWAWMATTTGLAMGAMASLWRARLPLLVAFASAAAYQGWITGQTGFLTAALLALAAGWPDRRPLVAGIAAGLLTIKPQLGLLIPIAFAAAGCWRAFGAAAITGASVAVLSFFLFGAETWIAFFDAMTAHGARMGEVIFPYHKLITPYGFLMTLGAPSLIAMAVQGAATIALGVFVYLVWRRSPSWELRLIALVSATALATPYAFYYEAPIFIPALIILAKRGIEHGWLKFEKQALIALWVLPLLAPGPVSLPLPAMIAFGAFALCARRVDHECPLKLKAV